MFNVYKKYFTSIRKMYNMYKKVGIYLKKRKRQENTKRKKINTQELVKTILIITEYLRHVDFMYI